MPLLSKIRRRDDEDPPLSLRPSLRKENSGLDRFSETDLVGEERAIGKRGIESKKRGIDLVWIQVHLSARHSSGELANAVGRPAPGELVSEIFGLVIGQHSSRRRQGFRRGVAVVSSPEVQRCVSIVRPRPR